MRRASGPVRAVAWGLGLLCAPVVAGAHGLDPAALALRETAPGVFAVRWHASALRLPGANVQPALPEHCRQVGRATAVDGGDRLALGWTIDCGMQGLTGATVAVTDLAAARINALLTIEFLDGGHIQTVLSPGAPSLTVPVRPGRWEVVRSYLHLGIEHILSGPDHLLFVLGLLLLVSTPRLVVETISAFTVGHSVTLSAAALGVAQVPSRPIEVLIALSILALAVELARGADRPTLLRRFPWAMALAFGLLHGFGFAGALAEAGLPSADVPLALLSFNGGIEIGQLAFVVAVLAAMLLWRRAMPRVRGEWLRTAAIYTMGVLAAFWCLERTAVWLS